MLLTYYACCQIKLFGSVTVYLFRIMLEYLIRNFNVWHRWVNYVLLVSRRRLNDISMFSLRDAWVYIEIRDIK